MKHLFLLIGFSLHLFAGSFDEVTPSSPDEIASLNRDLIVDGFVSAMSGQLSISEVDLHIKAAMPRSKNSMPLFKQNRFYKNYLAMVGCDSSASSQKIMLCISYKGILDRKIQINA